MATPFLPAAMKNSTRSSSESMSTSDVASPSAARARPTGAAGSAASFVGARRAARRRSACRRPSTPAAWSSRPPRSAPARHPDGDRQVQAPDLVVGADERAVLAGRDELEADRVVARIAVARSSIASAKPLCSSSRLHASPSALVAGQRRGQLRSSALSVGEERACRARPGRRSGFDDRRARGRGARRSAGTCGTRSAGAGAARAARPLISAPSASTHTPGSRRRGGSDTSRASRSSLM